MKSTTEQGKTLSGNSEGIICKYRLQHLPKGERNHIHIFYAMQNSISHFIKAIAILPAFINGGRKERKHMRNKYRNNKYKIDNIVFDSRKEAKRYQELKILEAAGTIKDLQLQVKFVLIPTQRIDGKVVERECCYIADFVYVQDGLTVVEDAKNPYLRKEPRYVIKRKLLLERYGIRIKEV